MALLATLVTGHILPGIWPSSRSTIIYTVVALEVNFLQRLVYWLINSHSVCIWKWSLLLILLIYDSWFPPILIKKFVVFVLILLYKGLIVYELLWWYDIHVTHKKFFDKLCNLLVLLNFLNTESVFWIILKYSSDVPYVLRLEVPGTLCSLRIYQYCSVEICNVLPCITLEFETLHVGKSLLQIIIGIK